MGASSSLPLVVGAKKFMAAVRDGDAQAVAAALQQHPELLRYRTLSHNESPLHMAAQRGHEAVLRILLTSSMAMAYAEAAAAASAEQHERVSLFARHKEHRKTAQAMLQVLANSKSDRSQTPLMLAAGGGHLGCVKLLLASGADPWAADKLGGRTALHYASKTDSAEVMRALITAAGENGVVGFPNAPSTRYVDVRTMCGFNALHYCAVMGHTDAMQELISQHANIIAPSLFDCNESRFNPGTTPLHMAASEGHVLACKLLLKAHMEGWSRVRSPDPRLLRDHAGNFPHTMALMRQHDQLTSILDPATPLSRIFGADELSLLGPPTLKLLASVALRRKLADTLQAIEQQGCRRCARSGTCRRHNSFRGTPQAQDMHALACDAIQQAAQQMACKGAAPGAPVARGAEAPAEAGSPFSDADTPSTSGSGPDAGADRLRPEEGLHADAAKLLVGAWGGDADCEDATCGVCLDARANVMLLPCTHVLCISCCREMANMPHVSMTTCPFCRAPVGDYAPAPPGAC